MTIDLKGWVFAIHIGNISANHPEHTDGKWVNINSIPLGFLIDITVILNDIRREHEVTTCDHLAQ